MKIFNIIFCILFVLFAALQYNDPDPYLWIPIYLYSAGLCFLAVRKEYHPKACLIGIGIYLIYALYLFFDRTGVLNWAGDHHAENIAQSMHAEKPWIEETREFFGLVILIVVLAINYQFAKKISVRRQSANS
jgi:general stress protein CsbA